MEWLVHNWEPIGLLLNTIWTFYLHSVKKDK